MARKWSNRNLPGALHYVTGNVLDRLPIFKNEIACKTFLGEMQALKTRHFCKIIAFVVMPDHIHLIVNPQDGDIRTWAGTLKGTTAFRLAQMFPGKFAKSDDENQVWQESFKAVPLWSNWMIWQKINYIHSNPIRARLVRETRDYRWSSFHAFYFKETDPLLQVDKDWWWPDDVQKLEKAMVEWDKELLERKQK